MNNRIALVLAALTVLLSACNRADAPLEAATPESADARAVDTLVVHKSPSCGCCADWVTYMQDEGFQTSTIETDQVDAIKAEHGLTDPALKSCHTALIDGYVVEGHVPADDVRRLLAERPDIVGLSAPGMPMQSPGMGSREPSGYDVIAFDAEGNTEVWSSY